MPRDEPQSQPEVVVRVTDTDPDLNVKADLKQVSSCKQTLNGATIEAQAADSAVS